MKKAYVITSMLFILLLLSSACGMNTQTDFIDIDAINVVVEKAPTSDQQLVYVAEVHNNTDTSVHDLTVLLGFYPPQGQQESGHYDLMFRCSPASLEDSLSPGESTTYSVVIPTDLLRNELINYDDIRIHLIGFDNTVEDNWRFEKSGPLESFSPKES